MLIAISKYLKPLNEVDIHRPAHLEYLKKLFVTNKLLVAGRQDPAVGAVIVAKINSSDEFQAILNDDPFTIAGVAEYKIIKFNPGLFDPCLQEICG